MVTQTLFQRTRQVSKLTLSEVCDTLRNKGWDIRIAGGMDQLAFEVISPDKAFAIRNETQLRAMLSGAADPWFGTVN